MGGGRDEWERGRGEWEEGGVSGRGCMYDRPHCKGMYIHVECVSKALGDL